MDGRSGWPTAPVSPVTVSRMAASGSAIAARSNAGLPRIAGTNAQPAAPMPTIPMRFLPFIYASQASAGHFRRARVNSGKAPEQETSTMLTAEQNEMLTRIGPGTPCGALMRRYWHPIAAVSEMDGKWTKRVRLLGEDLVLFKDKKGDFGLITEQCPHRRASLAFGIPTDDGIRCPYHGWAFDQGGQCTEQPNEPAKSSFKSNIKTPAYAVEEMGGIFWAYMGPAESKP